VLVIDCDSTSHLCLPAHASQDFPSIATTANPPATIIKTNKRQQHLVSKSVLRV
jgi:hypothetical protein